jgi:hypothetical protein
MCAGRARRGEEEEEEEGDGGGGREVELVYGARGAQG